jgi:hypothetical protein
MQIKYKVLIFDSLMLLALFICATVGTYLAIGYINKFIVSIIVGSLQALKSIIDPIIFQKKTAGEYAYGVQIVGINNSSIGLTNFSKFVIELMKIITLLNMYNNYLSILVFIIYQFPFKVSTDKNEWSTMLLFTFRKKYNLILSGQK